MKKYCLALDLKDDEISINEYEKYHQQVWPGIVASLHKAGIQQMEIYRVASRLFMIMETGDDFNFDEKEKSDAANRVVQEWEQLMWKYQQALPGSKPDEKWRLMKKIFDLKEQSEA